MSRCYMSLLDNKDVMYYFYDEMEKEAIIMPLLSGTAKIVSLAGKGAVSGAKAYGKAILNMTSGGAPLTAKHYLMAPVIGAAGIYAMGSGGMFGKGGLAKYKEEKQKLDSLGRPQIVGD